MLNKEQFDNHIEESVDIYEQPAEEEIFEEAVEGTEPEEKQTKKSFFGRIKDYFTLGTQEVPPVIELRYRAFLLIAAIVVVGGSLMMVLLHMPFGIIFCLLFGLVVAAYGYTIMLSATKQGYAVITGECIRIDYTMTSNLPGTRDMPKRYIIMDLESRKAYALPYYKRNILIEEGDLVRIYVPKGVFEFERSGIVNLAEVWGYEIVPELNEDRSKRLGLDE